jgi:hypothetical protein
MQKLDLATLLSWIQEVSHAPLRGVLIIMVLAPVATFAEAPATDQSNSFLCIGEQSTGFSYDKEHHSWHATRFRAEEKYIIRRVTKDTVGEVDNGMRIPLTSKWAVWPFGNDKRPLVECKNDFDENGVLSCEDGIPGFQFSKKNGRFIVGTIYGYVINGFSLSFSIDADNKMNAKSIANEADGSTTPYVEIGTCSAI